jgi:hypothetical protein
MSFKLTHYPAFRSGFGGGVWRKRQLLDLERNEKLPASL